MNIVKNLAVYRVLSLIVLVSLAEEGFGKFIIPSYADQMLE